MELLGKTVVLLSMIVGLTHSMKDMSHMKCLPNDAQMEIGKQCFTEMTGKEPADTSAEFEEIHNNKELKKKIVDCVMEHLKVVENGNYNAENAEKAITDSNTEQSLKDQLVANLKECVGKFDKSQVEEIIKCQEEKDKPLCKMEDDDE